MTVSVQLVREIRRLSGACCEYCLLGENDRSIGFQIDHIVPVKHGGEDRNDNLCLACAECNGYKGPNVAALDPQTDEATKPYHPRQQAWNAHFVVKADGQIAGLTSEGRATIIVMRMNADDRVAERLGLMVVGRYPCEKP